MVFMADYVCGVGCRLDDGGAKKVPTCAGGIINMRSGARMLPRLGVDGAESGYATVASRREVGTAGRAYGACSRSST